jgi:hypothetical protein
MREHDIEAAKTAREEAGNKIEELVSKKYSN